MRRRADESAHDGRRGRSRRRCSRSPSPATSHSGSSVLNAPCFTRVSSDETRVNCRPWTGTIKLSESSVMDPTPAARAASSFRCCTNRYRHCPHFVPLIFSHQRARRFALERRVRADLLCLPESQSASRSATIPARDLNAVHTADPLCWLADADVGAQVGPARGERKPRGKGVGTVATFTDGSGGRRGVVAAGRRLAAVRHPCASNRQGAARSGGARTRRSWEGPKEREEHRHHRPGAYPSATAASTAATRTDFSVGTRGFRRRSATVQGFRRVDPGQAWILTKSSSKNQVSPIRPRRCRSCLA